MTSNHSTPGQQIVVFLFAHYDDEFFVLPRLQRESAMGHRTICVYTTDGAAYGESSARRRAESQSVLNPCGVENADILTLGERLGIRDGTSFRHLASLWKELSTLLSDVHISRVYAPAWEGGHADHDAAHLLAMAVAKSKAAPVFEFSLYHSHNRRGPLYRCMTLIPLEGSVTNDDVTLGEALSWMWKARCYPTQRRAFLGLLPFCLPQILLRRSLPLRLVGYRDYRKRPYEGTLLYESRFKVPYSEFRPATLPFIDSHIQP
ncbi:MAG: hypothetical protein RIS36_1277 [Pseudomonadota bacterium]|jgi:LmbE family N-acetylglucosaminyl deacetylase